MRPFTLILGNSLVQNVTNFTVWFALLFWAFIGTRSVFVTGVIGGIYMVFTAGVAVWFGNLVDHFPKKRLMLASSAASLTFYGIAYASRFAWPEVQTDEATDWPRWVFIITVMTGVVAGNLRMITLPTLVTALIPEPKRSNANGLVGIVNGAGLVVTSAISGFLVARGGMQGTLLFGMVLTAFAFVHLWTVTLEEPAATSQTNATRNWLDLHKTLATISSVPGLTSLTIFSTFNNLVGGVFMALIDGYGLSLMDVQGWGLMWAIVSVGFVFSGLLISRLGVGENPVRTLLVGNAIIWSVASVFTLRSSVIALGFGCFVYLFVYPFVEAAEQTALQKLVPYERQGRVFGFAQSVEQIAAPTTSLIVGPLTQFAVIPFMSTGVGARAIGSWYGTGPARGMALMFTISGVLGLLGTLIALKSRFYVNLSTAFRGEREEVRN